MKYELNSKGSKKAKCRQYSAFNIHCMCL